MEKERSGKESKSEDILANLDVEAKARLESFVGILKNCLIAGIEKQVEGK
jgi:hypothetical protein